MRNIILTLCMLMIIGLPINAKANDAETNAIGSRTVISNQQIEILEPEEAKRIHIEALKDKGISPLSNLAMSTIGITEGDNIIYVTYATRSRTIADKIGARNITFQAKSGLFWITKDISNGYAENTDTYFGGFSMTNPTVGTQYRAECTHYVVVDGKETSAYNETIPHTYGE